MVKKWIAKELPDEELLKKLRSEIETTDHLLKLMFQRELENQVQALAFFQPQLSQLHDPYLMTDMNKAVDRILEAISNNEKIIIYGDYDVDGTTSVALVYNFLNKIHENIDFYIPDRFKEGYGISQTGIEWAASQGASLMIALDCGIKSIELTKLATDSKLDLIICDHHLPGEIMPNAVAILNPKRTDCSYPFKELSGCGIGFKLIQAIAKKKEIPFNEMDYLDLVAVSICSDIVQMKGENRIMTHFGLERINTSPCVGIAALLQVSQKTGTIVINDLIFKVGPRINAAGRIDSAKLAVEILIEKDADKALKMAKAIDVNNAKRQDFDKKITSEALDIIKKEGLEHRKTTVLFNDDWHKGVIGIVASRLIERYYRPTILFTTSNGHYVGSARSVEGFDIYEALKKCDELLIQWGGHKAAAGLTLSHENKTKFFERFEEAVSDLVTDEMLVPSIEYDLEIPLDAITGKFCRSINRFGPFGPQNNQPVFISRHLNVKEAKIVGNNHLRICVQDHTKEDRWAIGFNLGELREEVLASKSIDLCYTTEISIYKNKPSITLYIKDIQFRKWN